MAQPTLATVENLSDWIGEPIIEEVDTKRADLCLRIASSLVRDEVGKSWLKDDGTLADVVPEAAHLVTLYCASRVYDNREAQRQGGVDDYQGSWVVPEAGAFLTASERQMLSGLRGSAFGGLGSVATTKGEAVTRGFWVPTDTPGVYFPWG